MTIRFACAAAIAAGLAVPAMTAEASVLTSWNLVVLGDLQNESQDIEGNAFVGRDFIGGSPTVAKNLDAGAFSGITTLAVGRNVSVGNINMQAGNLRYAGSFSGNFNANGGGNRAQDASIAGWASAFEVELTGASDFYRSLTPNSSVQLPQNGQPGPVNYIATPSGPDNVAVFNVSAADVFNSSLIQQIELSLGGASAIVINVSGTNVNIANGNMVSPWNGALARSKTIWNFYEATTINVDRIFSGAILAPLAHLTNTTEINGSVFVRSMRQRGEVHLPVFDGFIPAPGSAAVFGIAGLLAARRRRA
ncbi:MAG: choice-of-anchor A family protein [Planctomycetota bacterium]|nr:choice-of-anchor A family protein [Planctomycetota bacterium]